MIPNPKPTVEFRNNCSEKSQVTEKEMENKPRYVMTPCVGFLAAQFVDVDRCGIDLPEIHGKFEMGYNGSGPYGLASAILSHAIVDELAFQFRDEVVGEWPSPSEKIINHSVSKESVLSWVNKSLRNLNETRSIPNAVKQTTPTNCFQACVATVLGIDISLVPSCCDGSSWDWDAFQSWLKQFGLAAIEITFKQGGTIYPAFNVPCIVSGESPRVGCLHAVVARFNGLDGFALEHDPHSSELWIDGEPTHCTVFVLLDPMAWMKRELLKEKGWSDK